MNSFNDLPKEMQIEILKLLDLPEAINANLVSRDWNTFFKSTIIKDKFLAFLREDKDACKKITLQQIVLLKDMYLQNDKDTEKFFITLKKLEHEILKIGGNPIFRPREKDELKIDRDELRSFLFKYFGMAGLIHSYNFRYALLEYDRIEYGIEARVLELAPYVALEIQLKENREEHIKTLELVNSLLKSGIFDFKDGLKIFLEYSNEKLYLHFSLDSEGKKMDIAIDDVIGFHENFLLNHKDKFKPLLLDKTSELLTSFNSNHTPPRYSPYE